MDAEEGKMKHKVWGNPVGTALISWGTQKKTHCLAVRRHYVERDDGDKRVLKRIVAHRLEEDSLMK